jgi:4-carboxymuconolactone decarboxylase
LASNRNTLIWRETSGEDSLQESKMARVDYFIEDAASHGEEELLSQLRAGRRGKLINVYRLLMRSPKLAKTWFDHVSAVRWNTELDGRLRELVIMRIARLNDCAYALRQHIPALAVKDGVTLDECRSLERGALPSTLSGAERAALGYAQTLTLGLKVSDGEFADLGVHFDQKRIIELTVLIGAYIMHNRVIDALGIDLESPPESSA